MILYSTYAKALFWTVMGLLYALMIAGAPIWAADLGLQMTWWKWLLVIIWFCLLNTGLAAGFTFIGEKEPGAGPNILKVSMVIMIVLGFGLWLLL
jgi:hypothetical protein